MKNVIFFSAFLCFITVNTYAEITMQNGILCKGSFSQRSLEQKTILSSIGKVFKDNAVDTGNSCLGWVGFGNEDWFEISQNRTVFGVNLEQKQYLGSWKISAIDGISFEQEVIDLGVQSAEKLEMDDTDLGCLLKNPLRFGDIDENGQTELVVFLGRGWQTDIHVVSTSIKKTIFSANLNVNHAFIPDAKELENIYPTYGKPNHPQYLSDWVNGNPPPLENGFRSFGKMFLGDMDGDEKKDIVLWRKYFVSKKIEDPIKGFDKKSDTYIHYKLINGEYKKQPTEQSVVKGWLESKNLTWQKGYPSKSECPGQEGQLIPEMHDPLLNDSDVLK